MCYNKYKEVVKLKKPTLKDIAELANLSTSTISRILNNDKTLNVLDETRENVFDIAKKLGYLKVNKSKYENKLKIVLIHWYNMEQELLDNYYLSIRLGIENYCSNNNIELIKTFVSDSTHLPKADGAICLGKFDDYEVNLFSKSYENIVFLDSSPDPERFDSVVIDFKKAYESAINYLVSLGHKEIGYIGGREYTKTEKKALGDRREEFFKEKFQNSKHIHIGSFTMESGYELMKEALEGNYLPAYLIASDSMAIGALKAINEKGLKVPNDISIIGFNDIKQSSFTIPPLTTIKVYKDYMGEKAVKLLIEQIEGRKIYEKALIQTKLIKRESVRNLL